MNIYSKTLEKTSTTKRGTRQLTGGITLLMLLAGTASAETNTISGSDTTWVLVSAALVLLMTPALGFFYGGMVRRKNVIAIITQCFIIIALISLQWAFIGFTLSFGPDAGHLGLIGGLDWSGLKNVGLAPNPDYSSTIPFLLFMIFQAMFAIITPALIIGSFADRMKLPSFMAFILAWATFVYAPIAHWMWGTGGWLKNLGALDFAGGTVVHMSAGISALAAALIIGKRSELNSGTDMRPHDITMVILGAGLLWFGWFGFNAGSALGANGLAVQAFVVTNMAGAAATVSWMAVSWLHNKKPSSMGIVTGAVCGLAAVTPASGYISVMASIAIGAIAGVVCYLAVVIMKTWTRIDDALDVFACHGIGGTLGVLLTGVFAQKLINPAGADGLLAGSASLMTSQLIAVLAVIAYSFIGTVVILKLIDVFMGLRVRKEEEVIGLDLVQYGEEAYPDMEIPS
ncbi:MAG: ammonium transporter [Candidatus Altiarchaeota archaeon]|nr:ammonium transporter [Candidatus Altiarchaeota archaeon]